MGEDRRKRGILLPERVALKPGMLYRRLAEQQGRGGPFLVAASGGGDSMALLLLALPPERERHHLAAGYVHHGTGEHADAAENLLRTVCNRLGIELLVEPVVITEQRQAMLGFEAAAREMRYAALEKMALKLDAPMVLTAHTRDDLAETLLLNEMRGAGLGGLGGLKPAWGLWRRPLLLRGRVELREFLAKEKMAFLEDPANEDERYTRVKIRRHVAPLLRERFGAGAWENLARSALHLQQADDALEAEAGRIYGLVVQRRTPGWASLDAEELSGYFDELAVRVLRHALAHVKGCSIGAMYLDRRDRARLVEMLRDPGAHGAREIAGVLVTRRAGLEFSAHLPGQKSHWTLPGELTLPDGSRLSAVPQRVNPAEVWSVQRSERPGFVERLDAAAVGARVTVRPWQRGDRFEPLGSRNGTVRVVRRLRRSPRERCGPLWVMETETGRIVWVLGERIAEPFKLTGATTDIWEFRYDPPAVLRGG